MVSCQWPNVWTEVSALSWSFVVSVRTGTKDSTASCNSFHPSSVNFNLSFSPSLSLQKLERSKRRISMSYVEPVPSPQGGFWGLSPPKQSSKSSQTETWNTKNQLGFCQFLECQATPHKPKVPSQKRKAPLLKPFWRRFCVEPQPILECLVQRFLKFFGHSPHLVPAKLTTFHLNKACFVTKCRFNQLGFRALLLKFPNVVQISVEVHHQP